MSATAKLKAYLKQFVKNTFRFSAKNLLKTSFLIHTYSLHHRSTDQKHLIMGC